MPALRKLFDGWIDYLGCEGNMPNYRRAWVPGGTYFFTVVTYKRRKFLTTPMSRQASVGCVTNAPKTIKTNNNSYFFDKMV